MYRANMLKQDVPDATRCFYCESETSLALCPRCKKLVCPDERREDWEGLCLGCHLDDLADVSTPDLSNDPVQESAPPPEDDDGIVIIDGDVVTVDGEIVSPRHLVRGRILHLPIEKLLDFLGTLRGMPLLKLSEFSELCSKKANLAEHWMLYRREIAQMVDREFWRRRYTVRRRHSWRREGLTPVTPEKPKTKARPRQTTTHDLKSVETLAKAFANAGVSPEALLKVLAERMKK